MEHIISTFADLGNWIYLIVFLGMLIEGNGTLFAAGFLLNRDPSMTPGVLIAAFLGAITEQIFWFWLGWKIRLRESNSPFIAWIIKSSNHFDEHFLKRPKTTLLISKFIYGVHRAAVARAGILGISWRFYFKNNIFIILVWMITLISLGFVVNQSIHLVSDYFEYTGYILLGALILFYLVQHYAVSEKLRKYWRGI